MLRDRLVLIIDDDPDARLLVAHQVAALGGRAATAATGAEGIRLAHRLQPDLITLDLMMPGMDGRAVIEALKADPVVAAIPVVVVSIVAREQGAGLAGAVSVLMKPLQRDELAQALKRAIGLGRVLVVDDDEDTQHLLAEYAYQAGAAEVRVVSSAAGAIAILDVFRPDLILLDILMPDRSGEAVLAAIAERPAGAPPCAVIVVTNKELTAGETRDLAAVTLGVVRKGTSLEADLRQSLASFVASRRVSPPALAAVRDEAAS